MRTRQQTHRADVGRGVMDHCAQIGNRAGRIAVIQMQGATQTQRIAITRVVDQHFIDQHTCAGEVILARLHHRQAALGLQQFRPFLDIADHGLVDLGSVVHLAGRFVNLAERELQAVFLGVLGNHAFQGLDGLVHAAHAGQKLDIGQLGSDIGGEFLDGGLHHGLGVVFALERHQETRITGAVSEHFRLLLDDLTEGRHSLVGATGLRIDPCQIDFECDLFRMGRSGVLQGLDAVFGLAVGQLQGSQQ